MRRRRVLVAISVFAVLVASAAWAYGQKPEESIFVSFSESERWTYTATHTVFGGGVLEDYGIHSGLRTREPWTTARVKIENDLRRASFRKHGGNPLFAQWIGPEASAFVVAAGFDPSESKGVTRVSITSRATTPEAVHSWIRDRLSTR